MAEHKVSTTDAEIEAALERAKLHDHEPVAKTVKHIQDLNLLIVGLSNHRRLVDMSRRTVLATQQRCAMKR